MSVIVSSAPEEGHALGLDQFLGSYNDVIFNILSVFDELQQVNVVYINLSLPHCFKNEAYLTA